MKPRTLAGITLNIALFAALALFALMVILPARGNTFDFYPRYVGAQAFWRGESPFSDAVTTQIQIGMFSDTLPADADQMRFATPAYTAVLIVPFTLLPPDIATALWMALQIVALAWAIWMWFGILDWELFPIQRWVLTAVLLVAFRYPITLYLIAQFTGVIFLFMTLGIYFLLNRFDTMAGISFAIAAIHPPVSAPLAVAILLTYGLRERWQGFAAFVAVHSILMVISVIQIGWWIPDFLDNLSDYARYATYYLWTPELFESLFIRVAFVAVVLFAAGRAVWRFLHRSHPVAAASEVHKRTIPFLFTLISTFLLLLPQTGTYYLVLLLPLVLASLQNATQLRGMTKGLALLGCASGLLIPWVYLLMPEATRKIEALLLPLHIWTIWVWTTWLVRQSVKTQEPEAHRRTSVSQDNRI